MWLVGGQTSSGRTAFLNSGRIALCAEVEHFRRIFGGKRGPRGNGARLYGWYDLRRGKWPENYLSISKFSLAKVVLDPDFTNLKLNLENNLEIEQQFLLSM